MDEANTKAAPSSSNELPLVKIFRSRFYRLVALVMGYTFVATTVLYYGIAYNAAALPGDLYVNNTINGTRY